MKLAVRNDKTLTLTFVCNFLILLFTNWLFILVWTGVHSGDIRAGSCKPGEV